ncbi:MAG: hypothetical protein GF341_11190 [candidate division Zixibacteria bacterium]|nr:hypothetical protein [candidate division Zixibacteria bacterium]
MTHDPFYVQGCTLITRTANLKPAINLRELRDRIEACPRASLYHHFCETKLRPSFDDPEYPNDFAVWAAHALRDPVLAERLGVLDPYTYPELEDLRVATLDIIDDRLSETEVYPTADRGDQFHFLQAMTVVFGTGVYLQSKEDLPGAVQGMNLGSIYYHFIEARRRAPIGLDDFTAWLAGFGDEADPLAQRLATLDFYFLSLRELKDTLIATVTDALAGRTA